MCEDCGGEEKPEEVAKAPKRPKFTSEAAKNFNPNTLKSKGVVKPCAGC